MAETSNADVVVSGLKIPDFPPLTSCTFPDVNGKDIRCTSYGQALAELPDILTGQRCYTFFDALALPIPHNLRFSFTTDGFETWWSMWKTHVFRRALGPLLKQLDAAHDISADQQQDGPAPMQADGSPFVFLPPAPVVLFVEFATSKKVIMQGQPISPKSAPKQSIFGAGCPRASTRARTAVRKVAVRKTRAELLPKRINETSSGAVEEVPMSSTAPGPSNSPRVTDQASDQRTAKPIVTTSASLPFLGEGCDPSSLLTFDPDSIEPAAPKIGEEPNLGAVDGPLQSQSPALLPVDTVFKSRVQSARQKITLRRAQLPLRADIAEKCQRLNEKKAALDAKTATSTHSVRLETLRKELEDLEKRARETKQLIQDEESLIARSQEEAQGLTADLKTDLAEIRALSSQLVMGRDEDDEVEIARWIESVPMPFTLLMHFFSRASFCV
ncbi:hypothetical protein QYE76_044626 [Lolium multiflorum]|uniref:Uncharacterized protein n=1 Tax=Lolium multiflorum TaxID=4521 RepID=A0AAD8WZB1_LOLMU|nr:hypothetical protein QYE76_044626 [Lolium multiflorum]